MKGYLPFWLASQLSRSISRRFAYWLSLRLADAFFFLDRRGRAAVLANLVHVQAFKGEPCSPRELRTMARRTFQLFGKYLVDFFRFSRLSQADIHRLVTIEHGEYLDEVRQRDRGVIVVTAHIGNWELGGATLAGMGFPMNVVALRQPSPRTNEFFQKFRRSRGLNILPLGQAVHGLLAALQRREFVALLADRDYSGRNDFVNLCGAPACLPRGPAWLAHRTGAPVLPGLMLRREDDTFLMKIYPPILPGPGITREQIQRSICEFLEDAICRYPSQWFMFERVWDGRNYAQNEGITAWGGARP